MNMDYTNSGLNIIHKFSTFLLIYTLELQPEPGKIYWNVHIKQKINILYLFT